MYKKILVAVDNSDISKQACEEAINLCKALQAILRIVHVVEEFHADYIVSGIDYEQLENSFKNHGQQILTDMEEIARRSNVEVYGQLVEIKKSSGRISEKILAVAKTWPADMIVIGTHGRRGLHHFLLGSVADEVIRSASIPILLIRGKQKS